MQTLKKLLLLFLTCLSLSTAAQKGRRIEVLFLGDSLSHHRPIERVPAIMAALGPKGINFTYTDKLEDLNPQTLNKYDALMIYANIDEITPSAEKALLDYVASGKGLLPIHCASYCFRNSEVYVDKLVGGQFWRHTMDSIRQETVLPSHPVMRGLKPFTVYDETYLHSHLQPDNEVLAVREIKSDQRADKPNQTTEPYTWVRRYGQGKIFYTALGHDDRTWANADFQQLLYNAILWTINDNARAAFDARNPEPFRYHEANLPNYEQRPGQQLQQFPLSPEESMKHLQVPVDFNLELFAAEPNVMHPIALAWDEKGRLYVLITKDYPNERKPEGGSDYILRCEDTDGDGKADTFTHFADGLSIPTGMVFANGGLVVTQAPDILFLKDTDGDGKADERRTLITGFGTFDTHAGPSNLHYGFDNWIWGCVGYSGFEGKTPNSDSLKFGQAFFRFKPDGSDLEWMTSTSNNTWGFAFNETNDVFGSTANNSHGWYMAIPNEFFNSKNRVDNGSRSTDTHRDMKPITTKVRQVDAFGGFTAAAGHNFYTARAFPKNYWNQVAFVAEPTGHILHQNRMIKNGTDYSDKEAFNLMAGADEWFSPVFAETGPDGAVWVADWYSFIIQHNPVPKGFENGSGNAYETNLRDFTHGRIYRISHKESPDYQPVTLSKNDTNGLLNALQNNNLFWRINAQRMLVERGQTDVVPQLSALLKSTKTDEIGINAPAIHALWTLQGLNALSDELLNVALSHPSADVRKNALKTLPFTEQSVAKILQHNLLNDPEPLVVLNALLVLSKSPLDSAAEAAFFNRLAVSKEANDRWLPDAFACVLTANDGTLMKKLLAQQAAKPVPQNGAAMNHDHHNMNPAASTNAVSALSEGVDLVVESITVTPENPAVRERIWVTVNVKNQGKVALPAETFVPLAIRFTGKNLQVDQVSRNYADGIASGQTVGIKKMINGPWVGDISFYTDIAGEYTISVTIDTNNELPESNKKNNQATRKLTFTPPTDMTAYALERAVRSYSSLENPEALVEIIRTSQRMNDQGKASIYKAIAEGWNYKLKDVELSPENQEFLKTLGTNPNLLKVLKAWNVLGEEATDPNRLVVTITTIREAMKFDISEFTVKAGQTVEVVLVNPDAMQHNIVFVLPNNLEKVGLAADKMMMDANGAERNYVPNMPEILAASPLVNPDQTYRFTFKAPEKAGDYPFVCTFPGHWRLMSGVMRVIP